jgi:hypothetical protein
MWTMYQQTQLKNIVSRELIAAVPIRCDVGLNFGRAWLNPNGTGKNHLLLGVLGQL